MKTRILVLPATALCLLWSAGCGSDESSAAPTSRPAAGATLDKASLAAVWPEDGSRVFDTFDLVVGLGEMRVPGRLAVITGGTPVARGKAVAAGAGVQLLPAGVNHGEVKLQSGEQAVVIQMVDEAGNSLGADMSKKVRYQVVARGAVPRVFFVEPVDGATVKSPFHVVFGVEGMGMSPALEKVADKTVGHHHILVNMGPAFPSVVIPADETHLHYGKAQTETDVTLAPGKYTLTMQFADGNHRSYGPRLAQSISVTVQ